MRALGLVFLRHRFIGRGQPCYQLGSKLVRLAQPDHFGVPEILLLGVEEVLPPALELCSSRLVLMLRLRVSTRASISSSSSIDGGMLVLEFEAQAGLLFGFSPFLLPPHGAHEDLSIRRVRRCKRESRRGKDELAYLV